MSGFLSRFKKRDKHQPEPLKAPTAVDTTTVSTDDVATSVNTDPKPSRASPVSEHPTRAQADVESPKFAVEANSIFKGLNLSSQATQRELERSDSPYLQRTQHSGDIESTDGERDQGEVNETSSFSFLHDRQGIDQDSDSEKNSGDEQTSSGFTFLNITPVSPKEKENTENDQQTKLVEDQELKHEERGEQKDTSPVDKHHRGLKVESSDKNAEGLALLQRVAKEEVSIPVTNRSPLKVGGGKVGGRQMPTASGPAKKKKKRKALIPGQEGATSSTSTSSSGRRQGEPESTASSMSDLSTKTNEELSISQDQLGEHFEQLTDVHTATASQRNDGKEETVGCLAEEVKVQSSTDTPTITEDTTKSTDVAIATDVSVHEEPTSELVAMETDEQATESRALEEVFGNYRIELSGEESYEALIESYQSSIKKIRDGGVHGEGEEGQSAIIECQLRSVEQLITQRVEIQRLKEEEAKALNDEDYELAEQLSKKLEQMTLLSEWDIAENGLNAVKEWMSKCAEVSGNERELRTSMQAQLTQLKEEQSKSLQEINKQLASLRKREKMKIQALQDKIDRDRGHIALDRQHLEKSEAKLKKEVENRAAQPLEAKAKLEEKLSQVESDIEELEVRLSELRRERRKLKEDIATEEVTIAAVREELSTEQLQLDNERKQIEARDSELKEEEEKLLKERHAMAATLLEEETKRDSLAKVIELAGTKCAELAGVNETLEDTLSQLQPLVNEYREKLKQSKHITSLHEQCGKCALEVEKMSNEVLAMQTKLSGLTKKVSDGEVQLQQLSDAKQAAITGRQFKEAGRLANEWKALMAKLEEESSEVKSTRSQLDDMNKKLGDLSEQLSILREDTNAQEKAEDKEHLSRLGLWTGQLKEKRESVRGTALEEVLEKWCRLNELLRESLSTKHGLPLEKSSHETVERETIVTEERTPGVGMEEEREGEDGRISSSDGKVSDQQEERDKLQERVSTIEGEIEKACKEEDFDKAAELEEELQMTKKLLER